ncbi:MAG TPA: hypothetical protein VN896_08365 [Methylomirabilota bacterium]|nr:hypothetical protein [Methylomirabilota bacterium]
MSRGALVVATGIAALCALAVVTTRIYDPDLWQHLLVGKVIWQTHAVPHTQLWTWPTHGAPDVLPSWLFRVLLWPFWNLGGMWGLYAWRWLTTFAAFGLAYLTARRMGATGVGPLLMIVWCAILWRGRSQMRPETFAGILLMAQIWLLERRRQQSERAALARDPAWGVVPLALLWANAHISYYLGFIISGAYLLDDLLKRRAPGALALAMAAAAVASLANPFGWEALVQPLQYFTVWRHEPVYQSIGELSPIYWDVHVIDLLPLWLALVVVGALVRWRRRGFDAAEAVLMFVCLTQALTTQRFLGYAALTLAPFAARDMADWLGRVRWPGWIRLAPARAMLAATACIALVVPSLADTVVPLAIGWEHRMYPEKACDWIERHGVRGRAFNTFSFGGYMLYRFYPDRDRLPFMDIHQAGTKEIRYLYAWSQQDTAAWRVTDQRFKFDWVLLPGATPGSPRLANILDADSTWAMVFVDDEAVLWLRRDGSCSAQAREFAYRYLPGGPAGIGPLGALAARDSTLRGPIRAEIERAIADSPYNARSQAFAGNLALLEGRWADARAHFDEAARQHPYETVVRDRQGLAHLYAGDLDGAERAFRAAAAAPGKWAEGDLREGQLLAARGKLEAARSAYARSLKRHPELTEARDSLEALGHR